MTLQLSLYTYRPINAQYQYLHGATYLALFDLSPETAGQKGGGVGVGQCGSVHSGEAAGAGSHSPDRLGLHRLCVL